MGVLRPTSVLLTWAATSLTTSFGGYNVYRRPRRTPAAAWSQISAVTVPTGYTAATVEAQHVSVVDYETGPAITGGQWQDGFEYLVTVVNATTGQESILTGTPAGIVATADTGDAQWFTSNQAPWLNFSLPLVMSFDNADDKNIVFQDHAAGRNLAITRTRYELPARTATFGWKHAGKIGQDPLRYYRTAQALGQTMCLRLDTGDRYIGTLGEISKATYQAPGYIDAQATLIETNNETTGYVLGDYNRAAGLVFDGSSQAVTVADASTLNPGSNPFTLLIAGAFANAGSSRYALSKGNIAAAANGYAIRTNGSANQLELFVRGGSGNGACTSTSATWFDGDVHCAIATHSGTAQALYQDDTPTAVATSAVTSGSITNAVALAVGGDAAAASSYMALAPVRVVGYWPRVLTAAEILAASRTSLGYPGYRYPYGASLLLDWRDTRCWTGTQSSYVDLSGNNNTGTGVASPVTRGIPWNLKLLEQPG